jgi:hypothetical protein
MIFKLFPQRPDHPLADGKELKRILAELLVERPNNAVDEILGWYESLKQARDFRLDHYFDVLRQLDDAAQQHLRALERDYLGGADDGSDLLRQRIWTRSHAYWSEVAALYSLCLARARLDPKGRGSEAFKPWVPLVETRLQAARRNRLKWLAYHYAPVDEGLWHGLGGSYLAAEAAGQAQKPLQIYPAQKGLTSVAQQYLHALVFFTSAMDGLLPQQVELADRLIAHFLPGFVFSPSRRPDSLYWVDAATGAAPARLARVPGTTRPSLRFLSPGPALLAVDELIRSVERGQIPVDLNLGGEYPPKVLLPVLRHLRVYWELRPPQRRHQRHAVRTRMAVLAGFDHCLVVFAGDAANHERTPGVQHWVVENVSLGGFLACHDDASSDGIKLGALLCMQAEGGDNWLLGVVRRFNRLTGSRTSIGVQVLSRRAQSVELRPRRSGFAAAMVIPGICLCPGGEAGVLRFVLPPGAFRVRESLDFALADRRCVLTPMDVEESGGDFEIARFREQLAG